MKKFSILLAALFLFGCGDKNIRKNPVQDTPQALIITAAFKSAEQVMEDEWNLIFRRLDNCRYIVFSSDLHQINSLPFRFIVPGDEGITANSDFFNLMFSIKYTARKSPSPHSGEVLEQFTITSIEQISSDRFSVAGIDDDLEVSRFILNLKELVKENNPAGISEMVSFPITTHINRRRITVRDSSTFIKYYDRIFSSKVKTSIIGQPLADVFASSKGLMIGGGEIWINQVNGKILITAINNI